MVRTTFILPLVMILIGSIIVQPIQAVNDLPSEILSLYPEHNGITNTTTPTITIYYTNIDASTISLNVGLFDVTEWEETTITDSKIIYTPALFPLEQGNHTISFSYETTEGEFRCFNWTFTVDTTVQEAGIEIDVINDLLIPIFYALIIVFIGFVILILYLKKTHNFTFRKFFVKHPIKMELLTIYTPLVIAFLAGLSLIGYFQGLEEPNPYSYEYTIAIVAFIGLTPYAIFSQTYRKRLARMERAFSQLLFEISDAMRGGLDPTKAVVEISKNDSGILQRHLKRASDNIKLGRPFTEVMNALARPINSDLIRRYASLIGETAKIGGEPAQIIHRAAKDMDDFIKVRDERRRQLSTQVTTIYIAFGVMLIVLYQLVTIYPSLGTIDISLLSSASLDATARVIQRMGIVVIKQRFLDLLLINSLSAGTIIGSFIDGNIRYGLLHSLIMIAVSMILFFFLILPVT